MFSSEFLAKVVGGIWEEKGISESLQIVDDIAFFCSNMQNNQVLFCRSHFLDLQKPKKNRLSENYCTDASRFVCSLYKNGKHFPVRVATESIS
jgi:hypothetical protein